MLDLYNVRRMIGFVDGQMGSIMRRAISAQMCLSLSVLVATTAFATDVSPPAASGPPITWANLESTGGLTFATWLLAGTYQQVSGRSSKLIALVAALGLGFTMQFLMDSEELPKVLLLGLLNGCQAYLAAAGIAAVSGAATSPRPLDAMVVRKQRTFLSGWF